MEAASAIKVTAALSLTVIATLVFWRYVWFFRNPARSIPDGESIVSPADGTVVYVKSVEPNEPVIVIKEGVWAYVEDILRQDISSRKLLVGIFMSPLDVHYNRAPLAGVVESIRHYPAKGRNMHMTSMHFRTLFNMHPLYRNSRHITENERTVTRIAATFKDGDIRVYVVQIAGGSVRGIDSYVSESEHVSKGQVFGMIKIGSQVDLILPYHENMWIKVQAGEKVHAGETILVE